jgi:hypothetical protein
MKIYYKLENDKFMGFHHLEESEDETLIEISQEEFSELLSHESEIYYSKSEKKLKVVTKNSTKMFNPIFDYEEEKWLESASLEEIKSEKLDYLKSSRDKEDVSPILFPQKNIYNLAKIQSKLSKGNFQVSEELEIVSTEDVLLDATESSKLKLKFSSEMLDEEEIEMWKCEDNVHRIFTKEELYHAFKLTAIRTRELFAKEHFLGLMVEQATTIEDLENIKW